ncbi:MAG TPA: class I SAM-dependent methyltransferase [Ktedonobacteraceae bacterium]
MTPHLRKALFETLYRHEYLYRFASTVPFAGQWRAWQRQVLPRLRGHDVLELGCGLGDLLGDMLEAGYACQAVEHAPEMARAARETLARRHLGSPSLVLLGSAQNLPFSSNSFDNVVSTFPAEYIYDPETIAQVESVLRPGGRLIVIEGATLLPVGFFQPVLLLLQMLVYGPGTIFTPRKKRQPQQQDPVRRLISTKELAQDCTTIVIENAAFGQSIPLAQAGLSRRSEIVRSSRWEVYVTIGEKTS